MKWSRIELLRYLDKKITFNEELSFERATFEKLDRLRDLRDVVVEGIGRYESSTQYFTVDLEISGYMTVPCAITLEDIEIPFEISSTETFVFGKDPNGNAYEIKGDVIDLSPVVFQLILMDIPWSVTKPDINEYPKGKDWEVIKEKDFKEKKKLEIDPRLAKLKEFKPTDD